MSQTTHGRDEIGVVRMIGVKVSFQSTGPGFNLVVTDVLKARSSSKRKGMFQEIQISHGATKPLQLQIDMPVRWSSTYVMLETAERLKDVCSTIIECACNLLLSSTLTLSF